MAIQKTPFQNFLTRTSNIVKQKAYVDTPTFIKTAASSTDATFSSIRDLEIGKMYLFHYNAKWRDILPVWDKFPLIFPFQIEAKRIWGINMHYLPTILRARLMDALYDVAITNKDGQKQLQISYGILNSIAKLKLFKGTVHSYLTRGGYIQSSFLNIKSEDWTKALLLQTARFVGPKAAQVYMLAAKAGGFRSRAVY